MEDASHALSRPIKCYYKEIYIPRSEKELEHKGFMGELETKYLVHRYPHLIYHEIYDFLH
jgi:hypothetical protein